MGRGSTDRVSTDRGSVGGSSRGSSPATSAASAGAGAAATGHTATAAAAAAMLDNVTVNMRQQLANGLAHNGLAHNGLAHGHTMASGVVPEWSTQGQTPYVPAPPRGYLDGHSNIRPAPGPVRNGYAQGAEPGSEPGAVADYTPKPAYGKAAKALGGIKPPQPASGAVSQSQHPHSQAAAQHAAAAAQHAAYAAQAHAAAVAAANGHGGHNGHGNSVMPLGMVDRSTRGNVRHNVREQGRNGKPVRSKEPTNIPARVAKAALLRQQQQQQGGAGRSGAGRSGVARRVQQQPPYM